MAKKNKSQIESEQDLNRAARESMRLLEEEAKLRERMNSSYDEYIKAAKEAQQLQETYNKTKKLEEDIRKRLKDVENNVLSMSKEELEAEKAKLKYLEKQNKLIDKQVGLYKNVAKEVNVSSMALGKSLVSLKDMSLKLPGLFRSIGSEIKGLGIFEMDKAMKQAALSMGVLSKESGGMRTTIKNVAEQTTMIGVGIAKLAKLQEDYSANLGRNVLLNEKGLTAMAEMSVVTGLGAEGTAQMAADMDIMGVSAERTGDFVNGTLKNAHKMGLNASKVMKNVSGGMKLMNKYNFKEGTKGLAKMAQLVTKLGVDMETAAGFADKLWNIEGAVEMSAQLNVMGGAWAQMSDPFHLMYMARNDMKGLTEEISNAAKQSVTFNKSTGEYDMAAEGMHKLKIIAEQTGIAYEDLVTMGKNAKKFEDIKSQMTFTIGGGKEGEAIKEFITNKSFLNKKGEAKIMLDGKERLVKSLTQADKTLINSQIAQQETMDERAKQSRTFDEQLTFFIDNLKVSLLPMLEGINKMMPKLDGLVEKFNAKGGWGEIIQTSAKMVGDLIGAIGSFIIEHPKMTASILGFVKAMPILIGGMKLLGGVWDTIKWYKNGVSLANGFNSAASPGGGASSPGGNFDLGRTMKSLKGGYKQGGIKGAMKAGGTSLIRQGRGATQMAGSAFKGGGKALSKTLLKRIPLIGALASMGFDVAENGFSMETLGRGALSGIGGAIGGGLGAIGGLGAASVPLGIAGGVGGSMAGDWLGDKIFGERQEVQDGIAEPGRGPFTITDKFGQMAKTHAKDGLEVGPHVGGGMKKGNNSSIKHEFGTLNISGTIILDSPGGSINVDIANNQSFRRQITRMVQEETVKQFNAGKPKG
jgi:hypothetical protein